MTLCVRFADAAPEPTVSSNYGFFVIGVIGCNVAVNMSIFLHANIKLIYQKIKNFIEKRRAAAKEKVVQMLPEDGNGPDLVDKSQSVTKLQQTKHQSKQESDWEYDDEEEGNHDEDDGVFSNKKDSFADDDDLEHCDDFSEGTKEVEEDLKKKEDSFEGIEDV